ncbi:hypothetical protein PRUB_a0662 [Pseudoalteromonas rubra]|uniref:Uncharacterized protein n=1 Tax=Pseudoalteromonas rubra TaxID=43658 RepID=A0A8T0C7Z0_9GAMM|nr:hypothetical protein PRUB_a0662 [Pseudoalteromonas rubra]
MNLSSSYPFLESTTLEIAWKNTLEVVVAVTLNFALIMIL